MSDLSTYDREWGGWTYHVRSRVLRPGPIELKGHEGRVLLELLLAEGHPVAVGTIASAALEGGHSRNPRGLAALYVCRLRKSLGACSIITVTGKGFALRTTAEAAEAARVIEEIALNKAPAAFEARASLARVGRKDARERRLRRVEGILIDQLEATAPHARAVARMIEEVYG